MLKSHREQRARVVTERLRSNGSLRETSLRLISAGCFFGAGNLVRQYRGAIA